MEQPKEDTGNPSLVEWAFGKLVLGIMTLGFGGWLIISTYERFMEVVAAPDLNGDGHFSILDLPQAIFTILIEIGHRYQAILADNPIGRFLEMDAENPNIFWSLALTAFTYFIVISWAVWLLDFRRDASEKGIN